MKFRGFWQRFWLGKSARSETHLIQLLIMHYSKIPSISVMSSTPPSNTYPQLKRQRLSTSMLQDVTNQIHSTPPRRSITEEPTSRRTKLMNKYVFGDASVIEEVKKRERKIMKDIAHFRNAIAEIEKETIQIREQQLPDMQYEISKRLTMCNEVKKETSQLTTQLDMKDRENDLCRKNEELDMANMQLKHSVEVQEVENQLKQVLDDEKLKWDKKIMELENLKPDEKVAQEIHQLRDELKQVNEQWEALQRENQDKCTEYEAKFKEDLEEFKRFKQEPMDNLEKEQGKLLDRHKKLQVECDQLVNQIDSDKKEFSSIELKIMDIQQKITDTMIVNQPLEDELVVSQSHYEKAKQETEAIQEIAHAKESYYKGKFDKMEEEQLRRRKLENTIEELKGGIRTFAYITKKGQDDNLGVNYSERTLTDLQNGQIFQFSRIIPSELETENDLLYQDCEMYHEMCLKNRLNYNLISVSQKPWDALRIALLEFIYTKCHDQFRIYLQYVFLSEDSPSQDLMLPSSEKCDNEIKLKIQRECIELDSKSTEMVHGLDELPLSIKKERKTSIPGIGILKFQLVSSDSDRKPLNFYFIEINDPTTILTLDRVISPDNAIKSPISLIIKKLLSDTTSCFLFDINDGENYDSLLEISKKLTQMKIVKNRRISI